MTEVRLADFADPQIAALIDYHQRDMLSASPPGSSFALDLSGLTEPAITMLALWQDDQIAAIGGLKRLAPGHAEVKSMRTHPDHTRQGHAATLLEAIIALAQSEGISRLSLETGSGKAFAPALALYRRRGFANGDAFAGYRLTAFNQCLHLNI